MVNKLQETLDGNVILGKTADEIIVMIADIKDKIKKDVIYIIAENRNFDIEIYGDDKNLKVSLVFKEINKVIQLNSFLPKGFRFINSHFCHCSHLYKTVGIDVGNKDLRGFLVDTFHEIGHAHEKSKSKIEIQAGALLVGLLGFFNLYKPLKDIMITGKIDSKNERNAWAYSLKKLRELEKNGFNVFDGFENTKELRKYVGWHLETYDENLFFEILDKYVEILPDNIEKFKKDLANRPLFNKRTKNSYNISI